MSCQLSAHPGSPFKSRKILLAICSSASRSISVKVADVDACYAAAVQRGFVVVYPLIDEPWGVRRFFVRDPDGILSHKSLSQTARSASALVPRLRGHNHHSMVCLTFLFRCNLDALAQDLAHVESPDRHVRHHRQRVAEHEAQGAEYDAERDDGEQCNSGGQLHGAPRYERHNHIAFDLLDNNNES